MIYVTGARYIKDYQIQLRFNDHKEGVVDLKETIIHDHRAIFQELMDINAFKKFHVEMDAVVWENGLDLAPEFLYDRIQSTPTFDR